MTSPSEYPGWWLELHKHRRRPLAEFAAVLGLLAEAMALAGVPAVRFFGRNSADVAAQRLATYWVLRTYMGLSYPRIAQSLGKCHTSIMSGCSKVESWPVHKREHYVGPLVYWLQAFDRADVRKAAA